MSQHALGVVDRGVCPFIDVLCAEKEDEDRYSYIGSERLEYVFQRSCLDDNYF